MEHNVGRIRRWIMDIMTSGMFGEYDPSTLYRLMMLNLVLIMGTPFVLGFGLIDMYKGIQPLGYIITFAGCLCVACFTYLRKTKNYAHGSFFLVFVLFWMFLYLLASGGSNNSGILWYYSFPLITLFLLGARRGSAIVAVSLLFAGCILFWPGAPLLKATYVMDIKVRFIPSVLILWLITSLFEYVMTKALKIEIANKELRETVEQLKLAREALSSEKERLAVTLRSIGDGVIAVDTKGRVVLMNKVAEYLTGWQDDEALGRSIESIVNVMDRKSHIPCELSLGKVLGSREIVLSKEPKVLLSRDGAERIISDIIAPILDDKSGNIGAVIVFRDITEQIRVEEDHYRTSKLESVGLLAGGIAHDFNNILTRILGNVALAKMVVEEGSNPLEYLERIENASRRASSLTKQLLTFAKGGAPVIKSVNLAKLIRETTDFALSGSSVGSVINLPEDLWLVKADYGQIDQVVSNLVINAIQASPSGGTVELSAENVTAEAGQLGALPVGRYVEIRVKDHGVGIEPPLRDNIFDPYFTTKDGGTGLGLTVAYSIVSKHGGHIMLDPSEEEGTAFLVYLPASFENAEEQALTSESSPAPCTGNILVVEDEEDLRGILVELLDDLGYRVCAVPEGAAALSAYKEAMASSEPFDLVITDLTIPGGMGGKELIGKLLELDPQARVIVSSGYSNDPIMSDYASYGFKGILEKPLDIPDLGPTVARVLSLPK